MKSSSFIACFISFALIHFVPSSEAIKCVQCGPLGLNIGSAVKDMAAAAGSGDVSNLSSKASNPKSCEDPLPQAEQCDGGLFIKCVKIVQDGSISRQCALEASKDGCKDGQCFYVCSSDGCNSVSDLRSSKSFIASIAVFILSFIMYFKA